MCIFYLSGISSFPQGLKQISSSSEGEYITFVWDELECDLINGVLLGYEVKLYYDEKIITEKVSKSTTTYSVLRVISYKNLFPNAISVAAVNEIGVGDHSPPLKVNLPG